MSKPTSTSSLPMFMKPSLNSGMPSGQMLGWQNEGYLHTVMMMMAWCGG
jgi:hypothetical protein